MPRIVGAVHEPRFLPPVVGEALLEVQDRQRLFPGRDQRHILAGAQLVGRGLTHGQRDRQRPRQPAGQPHVAQHRAVVGLPHEPLERAVGADREQLHVGHHPGVEREPGQ